MNYCPPDETYLSAKIELLYDPARQYRNQDIWGNTCLHDAILNQNLTQLKKNLHASPKLINIPDLWLTSQSTPLLLAIKMGDTAAASLLLNNNAHPNQADYWRFTPLHYACLYRINPLIQVLLKAGANPWLRNFYKKIPLDYYLHNITIQDLNYPYGYTQTNQLKKIYDNHPNYHGTQCKDYSALRWFVQMINYKQSSCHYHSFSISPIWDKANYLKHINNFIMNRISRYNNDTKHHLILSLATHLHQEYSQRINSCFIGFIRKKNLCNKINLSQAILNNNNKNPNMVQHDGRSQKLYTYHLNN